MIFYSQSASSSEISEPFIDGPVAAGVGEPGHFVDIFGRDFDAVGDVFLAVGVIGASVGVQA